MGFFRGEAEDWGDVPEALNMTVEDGVLRGRWDGRVPLGGRHTWEEKQTNEGERYYRYYTELYATFDPELLAGLDVRSQARFGRVWVTIFGQKDLQLDHAEFDKRFEVHAVDADLALDVLRGDAAQLLLATAKRHPHVWVSDRYVTIEFEEYERGLDTCRSAFEDVGRIAAMLSDRRAQVLAHWEPALREGWGRIADAWDLELDPARARLHGAVRGAEITAETGYFAGLCTRVAIRLREPLGCALSIARQDGEGVIDRLFRGQDVQTGDAAFDAKFVVKGEPEERVREVLGPAARAWLLAVDSRASGFTVKEDTLTVLAERPALAAQDIQEMLETTFSAAESLTPRPEGEAPFR